MSKSITNNSINLGAAFQTLMADTFTRYKGVLIERANGKYIALRKTYDTLQEAKDGIDNSFRSIKIAAI